MAHSVRASDGRQETFGRLVSGLTGGALAAIGMRRRGLAALPLAILGGVLVYRGATGKWPFGRLLEIAPTGKPATFRRAITIDYDRGELFRFWRNLSNLPRFMHHLEAVEMLDERRSHWVARAPFGAKAEWDAEITEERENEVISWRSLPGAAVANTGSVRFRQAPGGRGTEVVVEMRYDPPLGVAGRTVARLASEEPEQQVSDDLRHLKMMFEAGEIATGVLRPEDKKEQP